MSTLTIAANTNWSSLEDTSTSAVAMSLAAKTLTVSAGKAWVAGMPLAITAVGTKLHTCLIATAGVTSYSGTTLQFTTNSYTSSATEVGYIPSMWGQFANQALSQSPVVIGSSGSKVFWTRPNLSLVAGDAIRAINRGSVSTYIEGTVATYDSATGNLVMTAASSSGSGTTTDWIIVSAGTISNWIIHPVHNDTISVSNGVTLTIDKTNYGIPANVSAIGTGIVYIPNVSTSGPICFRLSCRVHTTNYGRITIQQNATFKTRGNYIQIATGTGSALSYVFPSAWDAMSAPTLVEVETSSGSGIYERWPVMGSTFYGMGRYGHLYGGEIGKTPTSLVISKAGGGTGIGALGAITAGSGYGGVLQTLGTITAGTGGTTGTYTNVALTVSSGTVGNGATGNITVSGGGVVAIQIVNPGSGYSATSVLSAATGSIGNTTGFSTTVTAVLAAWTFPNVPLTGGTGSGATANITIAAGIVTAVEIVNSGTGYTTADSLSAATTSLGAGASFSVPVTIIGTPLGTFKCTGGSGANGIISITSVAATGVGRLGTLTAGSGYVNGTYTDVPLRSISGTGAGARATIVVSGGVVTTVTLTSGGTGYAATNALTVVDNTYLGGTGTNFQILVSTLGNAAAGAYFSGFDGAPSAYAAGDLLTVECGGSIKPVFHVAEVGDFANTSVATNIVNTYCETAPTQSSIYQAYHVYSCTGGTGTGAKYVSTSGPGTTKNQGSQYGYFIAGTGYAVNNILTIAEGGMQIRVLEVGSALTENYTNKVCTWDPAGRTLRFGADPDSKAVPSGSKVRVPNIVIDALPVEIPLIQSVSETSPTWYFESTIALSTTLSTNVAMQCEYENVANGTRSGNTMPITTRGNRGTRKATHAAGAIFTAIPAGRATGNQRAQFNTSTGGEIDIDITMFGYWFQFLSTATRNISATNVGWSGSLSHGTTTGPVLIDKFCNSCHPFQQNEQQWSITAIQNTFALSNGVCAQVTGNDTNSSVPYIVVSNCPNITKFSNIDVFTAREWITSRRAFALTNVFFANDTTAAPQYLRMVGGMILITSLAGVRFHHISVGGRCCRTVNATVTGGAFSHTGNMPASIIYFNNSTNIICHNIDLVAQPCFSDLITVDSGSANCLAHTGNGSFSGVLGYFGNGAFGGINLMARILTNLGLIGKVANIHASNLRTPFSYIANNTQTQNIVQNVRTPIALILQNGAQTGYVSTTLNLRSSSGGGIGHGSLDSCDYVTGYTPLWNTGGAGTPNLPDATWFQNLVDQGISPTTGRIAIGCGGPNSSKTQYVVTGSNNSYPDNGGRFYMGGASDIVEFTNWYSLRGITGFQSILPASSYSALNQGTNNGWIRFSFTNAGTGYGSAGTLYSLSGGSGSGGTFFASGITSGVVNAGTIQSGLGYQVGDVLTLVGGGNNCVITVLATKTVQARMVPWGQDITTATYTDFTYTNLQAAFSAMVGYDSNVGLQIQLKVTNDANTWDLEGFLNWYILFTTVDPNFNPPIGYTDIDLDGLQSGSRIAAYSGSTLLDSDTSTTTGVLTVPYAFDGTIPTTDIKIKKYGYLDANYTQGYGKDAVAKTVIQNIDSGITQAVAATVAAYLDLSDTIKLYDYCQYYFTTSMADLLSQFCTKNGTELNFGSYNLVFDSAAGSVFSLAGSTITIKANVIINGSIITTGSVTYLNGAVANNIITSSAGTTGIFTLSGLSSHNVYLEDGSAAQQDYQISVSSYSFYVPAGATGTWRWRAVKYGNIPETGTFTVTGGGRFTAILANLTDSKISQATLATVLAYTTLGTWDKVYDYCQAYLTTSGGKTLGQFATANGAAVDIGSYALVVDAAAGSVFSLSSGITIKASTLAAGSIFAGGITSGAVSTSGGAIINTWYTSSAGRSVLILAPNIISGSRFQIYNTTGVVELANDVTASGGVYFRTLYPSDVTIRMRVAQQSGVTAKVEIESYGVLTSTGLTFLDSQTDELVYNANGIDGSTVSEFSADLLNVQIDISDSDGTTSVQRIYAWYHYIITTADGIRNFFRGLEASDTANYTIEADIVNLKLDNLNNTPVMIIGGYLSRSDGTTVIAATSKSIQMDPAKAYVAPSSVTLTQIEGSTILAKESTVNTRLAASAYTAPDNTSVAAIKVKTDNLTANPADELLLEAKLNTLQTSVNNLAIAGSVSDYAPTSITVNAGSVVAGSVSSLAARDNNFLQIAENTSTGLDLIVTRATTTTTETPSVLRITGYYYGGNGHYISIQPWDYVTSTWNTVAIMYSATSSFDYVVPLNTNNHNISTGEMKVRFLHNVTNYNASHDLFLDYVAFENVQTNSSLGSDIAKILNNQQVQMNAEILDSGTARGPGTGTNQIQLALTASSITGTYDPGLIRITGGAGVGQTGIILQYDGATRTATVHRDWKIAVDNTSQYVVSPYAAINVVNEGLIQSATTNTAKLNANASSVNDTYIGQCVFIVSGTGGDQTNIVISYDGATKIATMASPWKTIPDTTSGYVMLPISPVLLAATNHVGATIPTVTNVTNGAGGATLAEIEASTVLAKEASVQLSIALSA